MNLKRERSNKHGRFKCGQLWCLLMQRIWGLGNVVYVKKLMELEHCDFSHGSFGIKKVLFV